MLLYEVPACQIDFKYSAGAKQQTQLKMKSKRAFSVVQHCHKPIVMLCRPRTQKLEISGPLENTFKRFWTLNKAW